MLVALAAVVMSGAAAGALLTNVTRVQLAKHGVIAQPTERGLHNRPIARGAGVGFAVIWIAIATVVAVAIGGGPPGLPALILLTAATTAIGLADDVRSLGPGIRLLAQVVICGLAVLAGLGITTLHVPGMGAVRLGVLAIPLCTLGLVAIINLFNFMDGIDGLAAGQTAVAGLFIALAAAIHHQPVVLLLAAALAAALAGFLPFNWHPARCFMGDAGSYFCGAVVGGLLLLGEQSGIPLILSGFSCAIFLADGTLTMLVRLLRRQPAWRSHREHAYQRFVLNGWSHSRVATLYLAVACVTGTIGLVQFVGVHSG